MAGNKTLRDEPAQDVLPLLAQAALGNATQDPETQQLLKMLIQEKLEERNKEKQKRERLALSAAQAVKEKMAADEAERRSCNHLKQDNRSTRLCGQKVTGTGQYALTCTWCGQMFHIPALKGQQEPPRHLVPSMDVVGG